MVLAVVATVQDETEVKKTEVRCNNEEETHLDCVEEKTRFGHDKEREINLDCPDVEVSNGECPFSFLSAKKMGYKDEDAGESQLEYPEVKKTENRLDREWESGLECPGEKLSNGGCPFSFLNGKKTENKDRNGGESQEEHPGVRKTENGHDEQGETHVNHSKMNGVNDGCQLTCPSFIITTTSATSHLDTPSPRLAELLQGANFPGDCEHPPDPPEWLDRGLFNEGRKFYQKYIFSMTFSELLALVLGLAQMPVLKTLIHTGRSDSPVKARRRYLSTLFHLMSWYNGDVWETSDPAHRDLMSIRTTHRRLGHTFNQSTEYDKVLYANVESRGHQKLAKSLLPSLKKDLRASGVKEWKKKRGTKVDVEDYPVVVSHGKEDHEEKEMNNAMKDEEMNQTPLTQSKQEEENKETKKETNSTSQKEAKSTNQKPTEDEEDIPVFISQLDMSLTQYSFMGLILAHPAKLGAGAATRREMEGLIHFWRGLGWLLGIEDRFNFCSGTLEEIRDLCLEVERDIFLPGLSEANFNYEHMVSCLITGMGTFLPISFPSMLRYLGHTLDIPMPALSRYLSWHETLQYWLMRFSFGLIYYFPICHLRYKWWFNSLIARVKEQDKVNLAAYRKAQAALTVPIKASGGSSGGGGSGGGL